MPNHRHFFEQTSKNRQYRVHRFVSLATIKNGPVTRLKPAVNVTSSAYTGYHKQLVLIPAILSDYLDESSNQSHNES